MEGGTPYSLGGWCGGNIATSPFFLNTMHTLYKSLDTHQPSPSTLQGINLMGPIPCLKTSTHFLVIRLGR